MNDKKPYSKAIKRLLKGTVEKNSSVWGDVLNYQREIGNYLDVINIELIVKKEDGFAYIKQRQEEEEEFNLQKKTSVGFPVSVVLIVLRRMLMTFENDVTDVDTIDKIVTKNEIKEQVGFFLHDCNNKVKIDNNLDKYINKIVELGFLVELKQSGDDARYKIHRLIREKLTLSDIDNFKKELEDVYGKREQ